MAKLTLSLLLLSLVLSLSTLISSSAAATSSPPLTAHGELATYGFPAGLLPNSVATYIVNRTTGDFSLLLPSTCHVTLPPDNYLATYSKKITGKIREGKIAGLDGIRVRAFFQWWSITGIRSNGQDLVFEVGVVTAKYPVKNFDVSPECEGKRASS